MRTTPRWLLPVAIASAVLFAWRLPQLWPLVPLGRALFPQQQIDAARTFLAREGLDVSGHRGAANVEVDALALDHADSLLGRSATLALSARLWVAGSAVTFKRRGEADVVSAWVAPDGRVARWVRTMQDDAPGGTADSSTAARLATQAATRVELDIHPPAWAVIGTSVRERPKRVDRTFTLERRWSVTPELKERALVTVAGDRVVGVVRNVVVPDDARRARLAARAPTATVASLGYLLLAAAIVVAFVLLLRALRDGTARIGAPGAVAVIVFSGVVATFFLEPSFVLAVWEPLWPFATAPLRGLEYIGLTNAWLALVLFTVIAAGDAEDRRAGAGRGDALWLALRGRVAHPLVGAASWRGWLVGFVCGGVMASATWAIGAATGGATQLQPRGFFMKVLDAWSPSLTSLLFFASVALAEELGYRFFIGTWLERVTSRRWIAIWGPAVIYGMSHTALEFLPSSGAFWARPLVLTLVGAVWGWAFFRFDALTVVLSHFTADLFIFNWPRLATAEWQTAGPAALLVLAPLVPAVISAVTGRRAAHAPPIATVSATDP